MAELLKSMDTILRSIREIKSVRDDFSSNATPIVDKIYSFYTNPSCTCKGAIVSWISNNVNITNDILKKNRIVIEEMEADISKALKLSNTTTPPVANSMATPALSGNNQKPPRIDNSNFASNPNNRIGTISVIERTDEAFKDLATKAVTERWAYRMFSVTTDMVDNKPVWKIFFL